MEPTPPRKSKDTRPFYEPPDKEISIKIINEARQSLKDVKTKRPFTPREDRRTLFGSTSIRNSENRPPSAFSLGSRHFEGPDSRPVSGTKLSPLDHTPTFLSLEENSPKLPSEAEVESLLLPPKPPSDPNKPTRKSASRARLHHANSVEASLISDPSLKTRSNSLTDVSSPSKGAPQDTPRRIHSGPKERSPISVEERGEGDGREATPNRAPSSASVRYPPRSASTDSRLDGTADDVSNTLSSRRISSAGTRSETEENTVSDGTKRTSSAGSTGRGGSAGRREEDNEEMNKSYQEHILPLLEEMAALGKRKEVDKICDLSDTLYNTLEKKGMLGKNYKQRSTVLKAIFKMLDLEEPRLLLKLARLILSFKVSGNNLLNVCKLVFKVSRNEKNDAIFLEGNMLDLLLDTLQSIDHNTSHEALIYCIGAFKFLSGNSSIVKQLVKKDCVERLASLLASINKSNRENGKTSEQLGHVLVQLTATLRNLADANTSRERILACKVIDGLCTATDTYSADSDLILNISRIFSKVTLHTDCCISLGNNLTSYRSFLLLLKKHLQKEDIVVRVCFILGNMTAKNDDARIRLFQESNSMDIIISVLKTYLELDIKSQSTNDKKAKHSKDKSDNPKNKGSKKEDGGEDYKSLTKTEDVLVKIVRVVANISINEDVGPQVASNEQCLELLLGILSCKDVATSEELVLNTVATINNLSYYNCKTSAVVNKQIKVIKTLMGLVLSDNMEAMVEVSRVFGNLTRHKQVRDFLAEKKVDVMLITLLDSGNREVVYIACGVLINFMVDEEKRQTLKKEGGITKLVEVLRDFGRTDWELASMVCQILWNYSGKITSSNAFFGEQESQELTELLIEYLDKENAIEMSEMSDDNSDEDEYQQWILESWESQFSPVAEQLLQRIDSHQSKFEPLDQPSQS
ncbi:hypothetical protein CHS0354_011480 [Potamilus streckersoni]|uniref:Armadillo repeat-containing protein 2 n=1 Tax=Potamilus streckersoni TaxID=2493646 RepID=A0AAE0SLR7_9BIVA|nr:hypothetical protein CHS0354_011480 [Potamilus streckersoni]